MKWGVMVRPKEGDAQIKKFKTKEEAVKYYNDASHLLNNYRIKIGVVSLVDPIMPNPDTPSKKGQLWCPYCGRYRRFVKQEGYKKCELCGISTESFWVKKYNKLWGK